METGGRSLEVEEGKVRADGSWPLFYQPGRKLGSVQWREKE